MPRPNLLFILADQLRVQSCGFGGDRCARTPSLDRLAGQGVAFTNAVSNTPVCSAFRASLFTGKYTTSTGMVINELRLNPDHHPHTLARSLSQCGYAPAYIGKWHLYANELGNHHDAKNSFVLPGPHRLGFDGLFAHYGFHHGYYGPNAYYHLDTAEKHWFPGGTYEPDGQTDMAIDFLTGISGARAQSRLPFALFLSFGTPHDPWEKWNVPAAYYDAFATVDFPLSPTYSTEKDPHGDAWSNVDHSPELIRCWKQAYYGMTANLDYNVGRLMKALDRLGLADDTIVVFTSDHGEMFGAHGRMKKNIFYDEAARVPLLLRWPRRTGAGVENDVCISSVDLMPTLLGLLGCDIPGSVQGVDLSDCLLGRQGAAEPEFAFLQNTGAVAMWHDGHEWRAIRDKRYTYATFRSDRSEYLFDNRTDPFQQRNLVGEARSAALLERCRDALARTMEGLNDTFEASSFYQREWVNGEREIVRTATSDTDR